MNNRVLDLDRIADLLDDYDRQWNLQTGHLPLDERIQAIVIRATAEADIFLENDNDDLKAKVIELDGQLDFAWNENYLLEKKIEKLTAALNEVTNV